MAENIFNSIVVAVIASLITYFVTSVTYGKSMRKEVMECVRVHEQIFHQKEMDSYVEKKIKEHSETCPYGGTQLHIVKMLEKLLKQKGIDPNE